VVFSIRFFLFLGIFAFVKFIFIFFFKAAFEPGFIFDFVPIYILSGVNSLHLIFLSLILIFFEIYLHINICRKNLLLSFIPTSIILSGLGLRIATSEFTLNFLFHYTVFGCFLIIALIDQKLSLIFPDDLVTTKKDLFLSTPAEKKPIFQKPDYKPETIPPIGYQIKAELIDEIMTLHKETLIELRTMLKEDLKRANDMMDDLESKSKKLENLSSDLEERRRNLIEEERLFKHRFISQLEEKTPIRLIQNDEQSNLELKMHEDKNKQPTMLDELKGCAVVVKRGILKQASPEFIKLIGFNSEKVLEKNLIDFIAPEGLSAIHEFYIDKLKGKFVPIYETVFLTSDNKKIPVRINIKRIDYLGKTADIFIIENLDKT
jgi:PAS domain S-box-containing protein